MKQVQEKNTMLLLWELGSISSLFNVQLLRAQIPKALKDNYDLTVFFMLLGSTSEKAARKMLAKLTSEVGFHLHH